MANNSGEKISINDLSDRFVKLNPRQTVHPIESNTVVYREIQAIQEQISTDLLATFSRHRRFLDCEYL
jgi:hypothetical protein